MSIFFFIAGLTFATWASRIPDIQEKLHLSEAGLGSVLFALPVGLMASLLLTGWLSVAAASPPPDPLRAVAFGNDCPLRRVGTQFVRCDNLTGAGVQAPGSVPELTSSAIRKQGADGC